MVLLPAVRTMAVSCGIMGGTMAADSLEIKISHSLAEISCEAWNELAKDATPFLEWEWLNLLEVSESVCPEMGWLPMHMTIWKGTRLVAGAPMYLKSHSDGEFIWDDGWAQLSERMGVSYYPKLIGMIPATPSPGYRFLVDSEYDVDWMTELILGAIDKICLQSEIRSVGFHYVDPDWRARIEKFGYFEWMQPGFEWRNGKMSCFDDYLQTFSKNQRRNIRRERAAVEKAQVKVRVISAHDVPERWFDTMHDFYCNTNAKFGPWAAHYLTRKFFLGLAECFRERLQFSCAFREGEDEPVGMAFLCQKGEFMAGRYWGCNVSIECLHFDVCYYAPIEWAIDQQVRVFDPGLGSSHKVRRGFLAIPHYSLHRFYDERMSDILRKYTFESNRRVTNIIENINEQSPLKQEFIEEV